MNNRASLVDQWRLITYNANQLKAGLDLTFDGNVGTVGNNGVAFNGKNGNMRVGLAFDAPFTRRLQRNNYRSALIFYQQQRRALYQYQDGVNYSLRALLRQLAQLEANLEIQRRAVVIAVRRVDKTREDLNKPPAPVLPGEPVEALGPTVGQNLIFALNDLTNAQNNLMSVVLNYYQARMLLYRNLGIMELDDCGMWIDKPLNDAEWLTEDQCPMPPSVPGEWLEDAGVDPRQVYETKVRPPESFCALSVWRLDSAGGDCAGRGKYSRKRRARRHAGRGTLAAGRSGDGQTGWSAAALDSQGACQFPSATRRADRPRAAGHFETVGAGAAHAPRARGQRRSALVCQASRRERAAAIAALSCRCPTACGPVCNRRKSVIWLEFGLETGENENTVLRPAYVHPSLTRSRLRRHEPRFLGLD